MIIKLKSLIPEWISHGIAVNRSPNDKLYPVPGSLNDKTNWNKNTDDSSSIVEGDGWFVYKESNDWNKRQSGASVTITEDDKPHKIWIKIKTHGLRKANDTNETFKERVRKHTNKVAGQWISAAKKLHEPELNEVGNPIPISWKQAFKEALNNPKVKSHLMETGAEDIAPICDPVNFTSRK